MDMEKGFKNPDIEMSREINIGAMIEEARTEIMAMGAYDQEVSILDSIRTRFEKGQIDEARARKELSELLASRQEH